MILLNECNSILLFDFVNKFTVKSALTKFLGYLYLEITNIYFFLSGITKII